MSTTKKASRAKPTPRPLNSASEITPGVFVGGWKDAAAFEGAKFCVLDEAPEDMPPATHIPIYDESTGRVNTKNLDRLAGGMRAAHDKGVPVLVFCGHGVRRAPLGGMWYLHRVEGLSIPSAYEKIRAVRPKIETAKEWIGDTADLERA
jgi:protein-tyrosine phosphatase